MENHPDKSNYAAASATIANTAATSIPLLKEAYSILSNEKLREEYDLALYEHTTLYGLTDAAIDGLDTFDLSECNEEFVSNVGYQWKKSCMRCETGYFKVTEEELAQVENDEHETDLGLGLGLDAPVCKVAVQCGECSLWAVLTFGKEY